MQAYITSIGLISPQADACGENEGVLRCMEPEYRQLIPPIQLRRMSRILKLGLGASQICLNNAGGKVHPDAIVVGTGLACINDLETFLRSMIDDREQGLSPTPFVNSSHNTVAAQIARLQHNHSYNNTYCHRGASFECALTDALMLIHEKEAAQVLVGGIDEFSVHYHRLLKNVNETVVAGEGAAFFLLGNDPKDTAYARITAVKTWYRPHGDIIPGFLAEHNLSSDDIDTVLLGINGNEEGDAIYYDSMQRFATGTRFISWKHLCGEYMTSGAFALSLSAEALRTGAFPASCVMTDGKPFPSERILIFNHYRQQNYSCILVEGQR
ncbi:MAG: beta-ketoacyl synthase chain length factor [Dysgonamonadaceae bacterium]|jgi:3-oxoacyl-(acyl-carrier-protein) synthase|nr:beta-ketoacyl synthase chain length factor [Dysgonamonadaceae bacterium]